MKFSSIVLVLVTACCSLQLQAQQSAAAKTDKASGLTNYKCHLVLENRTETVRNYRRQPAGHQQKLMAELPGRQASTNGKDKYTIIEVKECVRAEQAFKTPQARELDRQTRR